MGIGRSSEDMSYVGGRSCVGGHCLWRTLPWTCGGIWHYLILVHLVYHCIWDLLGDGRIGSEERGSSEVAEAPWTTISGCCRRELVPADSSPSTSVEFDLVPEHEWRRRGWVLTYWESSVSQRLARLLCEDIGIHDSFWKGGKGDDLPVVILPCGVLFFVLVVIFRSSYQVLLTLYVHAPLPFPYVLRAIEFCVA
ncbi:hypothetical protein KY285_035594 [Solanum tuberosum]|nr:hypothetical protein KY285_035594 [Solanum tuberosum]